MLQKLLHAFERLVLAGLWRLYPIYQHWMDGVARVSFARRIGNIGPGSVVRHPYYLHGAQHIRIGSNFVAGPGLRIEAWDRYFDFRYQPEITIGNNVCINWDAHIGAINKLTIGNDVLIGSHVLIVDHSHGGTSPEDFAMIPLERPLVTRGPTIIEDNVWIGEGACILGGVRVGKNAIIGANAVVSKDVSPGDVVAGMAARSLRRPSGTESISH